MVRHPVLQSIAKSLNSTFISVLVLSDFLTDSGGPIQVINTKHVLGPSISSTKASFTRRHR